MIYNLNKENTTISRVIPFLLRVFADFTSYDAKLKNTGITVKTDDIIRKRDDWNTYQSDLTTFKTNNETWFDSTYPEYADALDGAITSLATIVSAIDSNIANNYTDAETSEPVLMAISQTHRTALGNLILFELES